MSKDLPVVSPMRLQRVVSDLEEGKPPYRSFEDLCLKVAQTNWAAENDLNAELVKKLIIKHKTITKTPKPGTKATPAPVAAPAPVQMPPPKHKPTPVSSSAPAAPKKELKPIPTPKKPEVVAPPPKKPIPVPAPAKAEEPVKEPEPVKEAPKAEAPKPEPLKAEPVKFVEPKAEAPVATAEPESNGEESNGITTYDEGGRGKRQCPKCRKYVGARAPVCACGYEFEGKVKSEIDTGASRVPPGYLFSIYAPAGKCPVPLIATDRDTVLEWSEEIRGIHQPKAEFVSRFALKYYASMFYDRNDENPKSDYKVVAGHLDDLYGHE